MNHAYPRPQLERTDWLSLDGHWDFMFDDVRAFGHPDQIAHWPLRILVPFPPESTASGIGDQSFHRSCWYKRNFELAPHHGRTLLHFGAVDYSCKVWIDGRHVTTHEGGHTPFVVDITNALLDGDVHTVAVQVDDDPHELAKPRGKQDWQLESHSIWYPRTTGIWQTVWIEQVSHTYIDKLRWTPHLDGLAITFEARIAGEVTGDLEIEIVLQHGERLLAHDRYAIMDRELNRRIILSDPGIDDFRNELLWSPERPTLFDATIRLLRNGVRIDEVTSYTALRSVDISRDRFMLNGRPYALRMVLDQGYWPSTLLSAPDDDALRRDVELAKAMGFNGVRKHQKIENPRYLYWADRLGLLVWEEMPSAYRFTRTAIKRMVSEWTAAIERDYSHPCVIVWVPFNESWGVPDLPSVNAHRHAVAALYHLTKTLDPTRPVIGNDGWESSATDIIGIHDYDGNPDRLRQRYSEFNTEQLFDRRRPGGRILTLDGYPHRGQPVMLTEFGGVSLENESTNSSGKSWGYTSDADAERFAARYQALVRAVSETALFSGFCYTQFADTFQETNGLLTADRVPKFPIEAIAAATRAEAV